MSQLQMSDVMTSFSCTGFEDLGTQTYYRRMAGHTVCAKLKPTTRLSHRSASCSGSQHYCTASAWCPSDSIVVGCSCWTLPTSSCSHPRPWKLMDSFADPFSEYMELPWRDRPCQLIQILLIDFCNRKPFTPELWSRIFHASTDYLGDTNSTARIV